MTQASLRPRPSGVAPPTPGAPPRRLLIPALSTLAMLVVLIGLGTWQVQRLLWKQSVLTAVDAAERGPAIPLAADPLAFAKVRAEGVFDRAPPALYGSEVRTERGATVGGARLLAVLRRSGLPPLLVDRGWVPAPGALPSAPAGSVTVEGYIRPAEPAGPFTPAPDLAARRFYALDPAAIGPALGVPDLAPFVLVAVGPTGLPDPARTLPRPANNHLSYVITWYGLAVTLLVIFVLYLRKARHP